MTKQKSRPKFSWILDTLFFELNKREEERATPIDSDWVGHVAEYCNWHYCSGYNLENTYYNYVNELLTACRWILNNRPAVFEYEFRYAALYIPFLENKRKQRSRLLAIYRGERQRLNEYQRQTRPVTAKKPFCEEQQLTAIFNRPDVDFKGNPDFSPKIGIELEVENLSDNLQACNYCSNGCDCYDENEYCSCSCECECDYSDPVNWNLLSPSIWTCKDDGSLDNGKEFVCCPLEVDRALNEFSHLAKYLRNHTEAEGRESCGLHFHIGLEPEERNKNPFTNEWLRGIERKIINFIRQHRKSRAFDRLFLDDRYTNSYCELKECEDHNRYFAVNFLAVKAHGTVEIRFCGVEPTFTDRWVLQFQHFVRWVYGLFYPPTSNDWEYKPLTQLIGENRFFNN